MRLRPLLIWGLLGATAASQPLTELLRNHRHEEALLRIERRLPQASAQERRALELLKIECLIETDRLDEAEQRLNRYSVQTAPPLFYLLRGRVCQERGQEELARKNFEHLLTVRLCREQFLAACQLAQIESRSELTPVAERRWALAVELAARLPEKKVAWGVLYGTRISMLERAGRLGEAIDICRLGRLHCRRVAPEREPGLLTWEARMLRRQKRFVEADRAWLELLRLSPRAAWPLLSWGFETLYRADDQDGPEHWLEASTRADSSEWSGYERFHIHLLQAQACLFRLDRPGPALEYLRRAERWASEKARPGWRGMKIDLRFHRFTSDQRSEREWVYWLWLNALQRLSVPAAQQQAFLESKTERLPDFAQGPWLATLARSYRDSGDPRAAAAARRALEVSRGAQRAKLLVDFLEQEELAPPLAAWEDAWSGLQESERDDVSDFLVQKAGDSCFNVVLLVTGDSSRLVEAARAWLQKADERKRWQQRYDLQLAEAVQRSDGLGQIQLHERAAAFLIFEGRAAEALAAALRARQLAEEHKLVLHLPNCRRIGARAWMELGEWEKAEQELEQARAEIRSQGVQPEREWECLWLQLALALRTDRPQVALALCTQNRGRVQGLQIPILETFAARARRQLSGQPEDLPGVALTPSLRRLLTGPLAAPSRPAPAFARWLTGPEFLHQVNALSQEYPEFHTSVPLLPTSLVELAPRLAADRALIELFVAEREVVVLVAAREGLSLRRLRLERGLLQEWIGELRRQLHGVVQPGEASQALYRLLWEPLKPELAGKTLTLVPQGPLLELPWDLLGDENGQWWGQPRPGWTLWAGEASHAFGQRQRPRMLALGGVSGADLPASEREVRTLEKLFPGQVRLLLGAEANRSRLATEISDQDVVHFACHALPGDGPGKAYLRLSDGDLLQEQIYRLRFKPGALVVLSCCNSADPLGQQRGAVTLASAFLAAGASQVVASLTPVEDRQAEELFGAFYTALQAGAPPAEALRQAKSELQRRGAPGDWAAFVLLGGADPN